MSRLTGLQQTNSQCQMLSISELPVYSTDIQCPTNFQVQFCSAAAIKQHNKKYSCNASCTCIIKQNKINAPKTCKNLQKLWQTFSISILLQPITLAKCIFITYCLHGQTIDQMIFRTPEKEKMSHS